MMQRIREARQDEDGFTLIELLIVIVVLGILAGIVVLGLGTFRADSQAAACRADAKQIQTASDAFIARPANPTGAAAADVAALVSANLLKKAPATTGWTYNASAVAATATTPAQPAGSVSDAGC